MNSQKVAFTSPEGHELIGRIELPADQHPHNFALFAHCFTCSKNLQAVKNISRALTSNGFGVLRFDFTGLGESAGDFSDSNFSGNVKDLIAAADFLKENFRAPSLLIGHSLGGAAVIFAANTISSVQAIATIGAPSDPKHVTHLLQGGIDEIQATGEAVVNLGGRTFKIKKQFLDDLQHQALADTLKQTRKPLLILHSPQDNTVEIKNAESIYHAAHHPKSFVSLDGADHLLSSKEDSIYTGNVIANWAKRYVKDTTNTLALPKSKHQIVASLDAEDGFTTNLKVGNHYLTADEPKSFGGNDFGPSPYEFVSAGLSACTAMTMQMYAKRKGWDLQNVEVHISHGKMHQEDCEDCENPKAKIDTFLKEIKLIGKLDTAQKRRLLQIADKCPVHKSLHNEVIVKTTLIT